MDTRNSKTQRSFGTELLNDSRPTDGMESNMINKKDRKDRATRRNIDRRKLKDERQTFIEFAKEEAANLGQRYGGRYEDLDCQTVQITIPTLPVQHEDSQVRFDRETSKRFAKEAMDIIERKLGNRFVFFTDGSCTQKTKTGGAGVTYKRLPACPRIGVKFPWVDTSIAIGNVSYAGEAEMFAIGTALELAASEVRADRPANQPHGWKANIKPKVYIITDSEECLRSIRKFLMTDPEGRMCDKFLHPTFVGAMRNLEWLVKSKIPVQLHWVKGHSDIPGNRRADKLAGQGSRWSQKKVWTREPGRPYAIERVPIQPDVDDKKRKADEMEEAMQQGIRAFKRIRQRMAQRRLARSRAKESGEEADLHDQEEVEEEKEQKPVSRITELRRWARSVWPNASAA